MKAFILSFLILTSSAIQADVREEIRALHEHAYTLLDTAKQEALQIGIKTEQLAKDANLPWEEANSIYIQAWVLDNSGHPGEAFQLYLRALAIIEPVMDEEKRAEKLYFDMIGNTGLILYQHEAYHSALTFFDKAYEVAMARKNHNAISQVLSLKSMMYSRKKDYEQADLIIDKALSLSHKIDSTYLLNILNQKSLVLMKLGCTQEAKSYLSKMLTIANDDVNMIKYKKQATHNLGYAYLTEQKYDLALKQLLLADSLHSFFTDSYSSFHLQLDFTELYLLTQEYSKAMESGAKASELYEEVEVIPSHYILFTYVSKAHVELGDYEKAHDYSRRYIEENNQYLRARQVLSQVKEKYQMEELTANFVANISPPAEITLFWAAIASIVFGFGLMFFLISKQNLA